MQFSKAIYAAKKPSRYGTVQVRMLEIPHEEMEAVPVPTTKPISQQVDLQGGLSHREEQYKQALSTHAKTEESLEI